MLLKILNQIYRNILLSVVISFLAISHYLSFILPSGMARELENIFFIIIKHGINTKHTRLRHLNIFFCKLQFVKKRIENREVVNVPISWHCKLEISDVWCINWQISLKIVCNLSPILSSARWERVLPDFIQNKQSLWCYGTMFVLNVKWLYNFLFLNILLLLYQVYQPSSGGLQPIPGF